MGREILRHRRDSRAHQQRADDGRDRAAGRPGGGRLFPARRPPPPGGDRQGHAPQRLHDGIGDGRRLHHVGMDVVLLGPMPTPAVAMLTRSMRADLGVMISASHNPFADNGIKLFGPDGYKLSDEAELAIERRLERAAEAGQRPSDRPGQADRRRPRPLHPFRQVDLPRASAARRAEGRDRLRQWRRLSCRARRAVGAGRRRRPARRHAQRHQHQRRLRLDPPAGAARDGGRVRAPTSAWRSTAMPTG